LAKPPEDAQQLATLANVHQTRVYVDQDCVWGGFGTEADGRAAELGGHDIEGETKVQARESVL